MEVSATKDHKTTSQIKLSNLDDSVTVKDASFKIIITEVDK